jgi:hypothetical protein
MSGFKSAFQRALIALWLAPLAACSVFSPAPAWELVKAAGSAGSAALAYGPSEASQTVHHGEAPVSSLCIEYNRDAQAADLVPALQAELRELRVDSRVYEAGIMPPRCEVWLRYAASIQWGTPPLSSAYKSYLSAASLSLHRANGRLMASSSYELDERLGIGRWASTRSKLAPVVKALITGFSS